MIHFMLPMLLLAQDVDEVELPPELTGEFVPKPGFKLYGEYLVWWLRRAYAPPILTAGTAASQGVLGQPGTRVIYGDEWLETRHDDRFIGGRFGAEWMHRSGEFGLEGRAFFLERDSTYKTIKWRTDPLMALSYKDASTGRESSIVISGEDATRGLLSGGFVGYSRVELFGQEINGVVPLRSHGHWKVDALAGARFLQLRDRYHHTATNWETPANQVLTGIIDNYRYHNAFYGGQIGLKGESQWNRQPPGPGRHRPGRGRANRQDLGRINRPHPDFAHRDAHGPVCPAREYRNIHQLQLRRCGRGRRQPRIRFHPLAEGIYGVHIPLLGRPGARGFPGAAKHQFRQPARHLQRRPVLGAGHELWV